jgi:acetyltransferase-like isoleucine patch superfamily enzyme
MAFLPNRIVGISEDAEQLYGRWLGSIEHRLNAPDCDRYELCRTVLTEIHFPHLGAADPLTLPLATQVALAQMDARNVTLEPEYYAEIDLERYQRIKPLIWLWVVVHRHVLLDDRGGIRLGDGVSISDFANVYSHSHGVVEGREISTPVTVIDTGVRVTYHATVMSGVHLAEGSMLGAFAVATRDTDPNGVYAGIPAKKIKAKPAESRLPRTPDPLADPPA